MPDAIIRRTMGKHAALLLLLLALASCTPSQSTRAVAIKVDGEVLVGSTAGPTVRDALADFGVSLGDEDWVEPAETSVVDDGMTIRVIRVETRSEVVRRVLAFERQTVLDVTIPEGETHLLEPGRTGLEERTYRIRLEDGEPVDRALVRQAVLEEPRPEVVLVGGWIEYDPVILEGTIAALSGGNAWLMRTTSANRRRLTHSGDLDGRVFRLSPDGAHILFTRATTDKVDGDTEGAPTANLNTLWLMETHAAAAQARQLGAYDVLWADWGPDCRESNVGSGCVIAYASGVATAGSPGWRAENDLTIAEPDPVTGQLGSQVRIIEPSSGGLYGWWGTTYAWAPDGHRLAYARADEIGMVSVPTGTVTTLVSFPPYRTYATWVWAPSLSWSTDGAFIVTTLHSPPESDPAPEDSPAFDIWTIGSDGRLQARLVPAAGMWAAPRYSTRGDAIAYGQSRSPRSSATSSYDLVIVDRDGSGASRVFPAERELGLDFVEAAWAPSSDRLVVVYRGDVYLISLEDDTALPLTGDGDATQVEWR
jgi:hypothetical protein